MRHWLLLYSAVFLLGFSQGGSAAELQSVKPQAIPTGPDTRLNKQLANYSGSPVLINFWATWCEPCREEMPALYQLAVRSKSSGLVVLTVAVADNVKAVDKFLAEVLPAQESLPVLHDHDQVISRAWGVRMLPTTLLLDRRHRLVARGHGALEWDNPAFDQKLKSLIN
jgi:thiol-disulfide isomerase/thioredoxin